MAYERRYTKVKKKNVVIDVKKESIAQEMGIKKGYQLVSINGEKIVDILDYKFLTCDEYLEIEFLNENGETEFYELEKEEDEDIGLIFESELIDEAKNCHNNCIFCFMNQLPKEVRETLIFKDDDYRLSFFSGNYITMTNMKDEDVDRMIRYRLSPINISVHATDEAIRCKMLNNKSAGKVMAYIEKLYNAEINMNTQIVLCKGINDGDILDRTIMDLSKYFPVIRCIAIVPVGLTKHRNRLYNLETLTSEDCKNVIDIVEKHQKVFKKKYKDNVVYLADEFYLKAGEDIPKYCEYGDLYNIENGIGMVADFNHEFDLQVKKIKVKDKNNVEKISIIDELSNINVHILTGCITKTFIEEKINILNKYFNNLNIKAYGVINNFFGEEITVTGLMTGSDIIKTVKEIKSGFKKDSNNIFVIPNVCLKEDEDVFLDDVKLSDVREVCRELVVTDNTAKGFINSLKKISKLKMK